MTTDNNLMPPYKPGTSGNPAGKPKGIYTTDTSTVALERARRAALRLVIERAKAGDIAACSVLLNYNPPRTG